MDKLTRERLNEIERKAFLHNEAHGPTVLNAKEVIALCAMAKSSLALAESHGEHGAPAIVRRVNHADWQTEVSSLWLANKLGQLSLARAAVISAGTLRAKLAEAEGKLDQAQKAWQRDVDTLHAVRDKAEARVAELSAFVESMVSAVGPYPYINGTGLVADAYKALHDNPTPPKATDGLRAAAKKVCSWAWEDTRLPIFHDDNPDVDAQRADLATLEAALTGAQEE